MSGDVVPLREVTRDEEAARCVVALLEAALERARAGEFRGALLLVEVDGERAFEAMHTESIDFLRRLGGLEALKAVWLAGLEGVS